MSQLVAHIPSKSVNKFSAYFYRTRAPLCFWSRLEQTPIGVKWQGFVRRDFTTGWYQSNNKFQSRVTLISKLTISRDCRMILRDGKHGVSSVSPVCQYNFIWNKNNVINIKLSFHFLWYFPWVADSCVLD